MTELCKLAEKYGTDKLGVYTPFYDLLLRDRRERTRNVLEIGIGTPEAMQHVKGYRAGASLRMWRDYFPNAEIYGVDITSAAIAEASDPPRILTHHIDDFVRYPKFDLIVDDGSHTAEDQMRYFKICRLSLAKDGLYIIEDVDDFSQLSPHLPEHTLIQHIHGKEVGRCILIRG